MPRTEAGSRGAKKSERHSNARQETLPIGQSHHRAAVKGFLTTVKAYLAESPEGNELLDWIRWLNQANLKTICTAIQAYSL